MVTEASSEEEARPTITAKVFMLSYKKSGHRPQMQTSSSSKVQERCDRSFGSQSVQMTARKQNIIIVDEKQITFAPE